MSCAHQQLVSIRCSATSASNPGHAAALLVWVLLPSPTHVQVFEDMPQEMRSRFWYVLLERPDLAQQLLVSQHRHGRRAHGRRWRNDVGTGTKYMQLLAVPAQAHACSLHSTADTDTGCNQLVQQLLVSQYSRQLAQLRTCRAAWRSSAGNGCRQLHNRNMVLAAGAPAGIGCSWCMQLAQPHTQDAWAHRHRSTGTVAGAISPVKAGLALR